MSCLSGQNVSRAYRQFHVSGGSRDVDKKKARSLEGRGPGWGVGGGGGERYFNMYYSVIYDVW